MAAEEDAILFRTAIGAVTPLSEHNRVLPARPAPQTSVRASTLPHTLADTLSDLSFEHAPDEFLRNGVSRLTLRKLRRSAVQDTLDLHGNTTDAARALLQQFLFAAVQGRLRCVLVIHGKGINSQNGEAVLRTHTRRWLVQHPQVLAFCAAPPEKGGSGAVLILLKH